MLQRVARPGQPRGPGRSAIAVIGADTIRAMWVLFDLNGTLVDPGGPDRPAALPIAALDEANMMAMITLLAGREAAFAAARRGAAARAGAAGATQRAAGGAGAAAGDAGLPGRPGGAGAPARRRAPARRPDAVLDRGRGGVLADVRAARRLRARPLRARRGAFKPEDLAYRCALERAGATDAWFVAGHWWDVAGAAYAGPAHRLGQPDRPRLPGAMPARDLPARTCAAPPRS